MEHVRGDAPSDDPGRAPVLVGADRDEVGLFLARQVCD
jgi:hypothetical protein